MLIITAMLFIKSANISRANKSITATENDPIRRNGLLSLVEKEQ
jgi:hypothetical protein